LWWGVSWNWETTSRTALNRPWRPSCSHSMRSRPASVLPDSVEEDPLVLKFIPWNLCCYHTWYSQNADWCVLLLSVLWCLNHALFYLFWLCTNSTSIFWFLH
jgi:hypothetical protein